jgi:hypothetical protein
MVSRVNFLETDSNRIEPGYVGYIVLGDRRSGDALGVTLWESDEAREASDAKARTIRPRVKRRPEARCKPSSSTKSSCFDVRGG